MTDTEHDKALIRKIFDQFIEMSNAEFKTETGKEMGAALSYGISNIIKPYMIELSKELK